MGLVREVGSDLKLKENLKDISRCKGSRGRLESERKVGNGNVKVSSYSLLMLVGDFVVWI